MRRLVDLQNFSKVTAPFAGTITSRTIDRGALFNDTGTTPMFTLVATDPIRVFIDVPQIGRGEHDQTAPTSYVTVRELAGSHVPRQGRALGRRARSGPPHDVDRGRCAEPRRRCSCRACTSQAALTLPVPHRVVEIPTTALYSDASGPARRPSSTGEPSEVRADHDRTRYRRGAVGRDRADRRRANREDRGARR